MILNNPSKRLRTAILAALMMLPATMFATSSAHAAAAVELLADPSAEAVVSTTSPGDPWSDGSYGTNVHALSVTSDAATAAKALRVDVSAAAANSDAKWFPKPVSVTGGGAYTFSVKYKSSVATEIDAQFTAGGTTTYPWIADLPAASTWTQKTVNVTVPLGANATASLFVPLASQGWLITDDYSLTAAAPVTPPPAPTPGAITNGGLETIDAANGLPSSWKVSQWGTNTSTAKTVTTAHAGTSAVRVDMSGFVSGSTNIYQIVPATAGKTYKICTWVATTQPVQLAVHPVNAAGAEGAYSALANVAANNTGTVPSTWTQACGAYAVPAGYVAIEVLVPFGANGWVVTDDYTMTLSTAPASFSQAAIAVNLDDAWSNQYLKARPLMTGIPATVYVIGNAIGTPDYMSATQLKTWAASGSEIGNHTWDHTDPGADLADRTAAQIESEFTKAQTAIKNKVGITTTSCAFPRGSYKPLVLTIAAKYFKTCRSVDSNPAPTYGTMSPAQFAGSSDFKYRLWDYNVVGAATLADGTVVKATTVADIQNAVNYAKANKLVFIPTFHEVVDTKAQAVGGDQYYTLTSTFKAMMDVIRNSGVALKTNSQLIDFVASQIP